MTSPSDQLASLNLRLPKAPKPVAAYVPAVKTGNLLFISGQIPFRDGQLMATGSVPGQVSMVQAQQCAQQCVLNGLAVVADQLNGDLSRVNRIVKVGVFVASDPEFGDQPKVANGASELLEKIFGEAGRHARAAVGCSALPLNVPVEVEFIIEVR